MQVPNEMIEDFRNHVWACFKYLGIGEPTPIQYAIAHKMANGPKDFQLQAGRGKGKSVIASCYVSWLVMKDPNTTILVLSATADKAIKFVSQVRQILELVPYMEHLRPGEWDKDNAFGFNIGGKTRIGQDLSVTAKGISGQITGSHADHIIADDVEIESNADTASARERLLEKLAELEQVRNPTDEGTIRILGTFQSADSVYLKLPYQVIKFPAVIPCKHNEIETKDVDEFVMNLEGNEGDTTEPERFSNDLLAERKAKIGPKLFSLHYKLDPSLSDRAKYPLKLEDLIVMDVSPDLFPEKVVWGKATPYKDLPIFGITGDMLYTPQWVSTKFYPYTQTVLFVDPSGRGTDETAICVASFINGYVVIHELLGLPGGYDTPTLTKIAKLAYQYSIKEIQVESNFGDAMYANLLRPIVSEMSGQVAIGDFRVRGAKEERVIRTLEPIMSQHRLIFDKKPIRDEENQRQITRIQERRGSLKHDDRVDILASAVHHWDKALAIAPDVVVSKNAAKDLRDKVNDWLGNKRALGILGEKVSGAVLINDKKPSGGKPFRLTDRFYKRR